MKFKLQFDIPESVLDLSVDSKAVFLGSCFADNISERMISLGLPVFVNPFGTLFHPDPLAYQLNAALDNSMQVNVLQRNNVFLDWMSASKVAAASEIALREEIGHLRSMLLDRINDAQLLVISFGTAWGYSRNDIQNTVGNCHKQPAVEFVKELFDPERVSLEWQQLIQRLHGVNPNLKIALTVSPVRHIKDGLIENNRSKARLLELVHALNGLKNVYYFPAYEILIDELRDYRFYSSDLVHPNDLAIQYIFDQFIHFAYNKSAKLDLKEIKSYIQLRDHRVIHSFSDEEQERLRIENEKRFALLNRFPGLLI